MKTYILPRVLLALHITGLVIMAGITTIDYFTFKIFWKFADCGDGRSLEQNGLKSALDMCFERF